MNSKEKEFLKKLLAAFKIEAEEHIRTITAGLLELEKERRTEQRDSLVETIFREAHSLKGAARSVNMTEIETVCQALESVFHDWKEGNKAPDVREFDSLHRRLDTISQLLLAQENAPPRGTAAGPPSPQQESEPVKPQAGGASRKAGKRPALEKETRAERKAGTTAEKARPDREPAAEEAEPPNRPRIPAGKEKSVLQETVRIQAAELDSLLRQTEELSFIKLELDQYLGSLKETSESLELWKKQWSQAAPQLKQLFQTIDKGSAGTEHGVSGLPEVLENNFEHFKLLETRLAGLEKSVEADRRTVSAMVDTLLAGLKNTLMSPCSSMLEIFPKIVRELSRDQGKQVELQLRGGEVEIDRRIMEQIKEPLIHLVRNSIDHGIEKPELRERLNKPSLGRLTMAINQLKSNQIEILVSDDGAGIDLEKIKKAAVKKGIISEKEARRLTDQEALALIFESNISTSAIITDISGRGLGLTIVREKVEKVSGSVAVETSPNAGTTFRLVLPITLASFRAVLVKVNGQPFAIPTMQVLQSRKINKEEVKTVENRETISANGYTLPLVRLADVLELRERSEEERSGPVSALILGTADKLVAFSVDQLLGEQEILLKSLGSQLSRVRNITGATILGSGQVVPVLNVSDLIKSARQATAAQSEALIPAAEKAKKKSILVVEDSITARMLLKNILESAGYAVKTAVDGLDGFTQLRTADFDLLVSDVDMPRLNGFDLTSKVRGDRKLADLPVVLVTALDSRADRERGIDVGANAYIVKSTFDQSNLLEVIQRLI